MTQLQQAPAWVRYSIIFDVRVAMGQAAYRRYRQAKSRKPLSWTRTRRPLLDATALHLITHVDDKTGASVRMWEGIGCAPIEWAAIFRQHNATAQYACTECGHHGSGQVPGCSCGGCDDR